MSKFHPVSNWEVSCQLSQDHAKVLQKKTKQDLAFSCKNATQGGKSRAREGLAPPFLLYWLLHFPSRLLWSGVVARHPAASLLTGRAGGCLFPYSMAGANGGTSVFCSGREPAPGAAAQSTADAKVPGRNEEPPPTAAELPPPQLRSQPLPRAPGSCSGRPPPPPPLPPPPAGPGPVPGPPRSVLPQRHPLPRQPGGLPASRHRPTVLCVPAALELPDWRGGGGGALPSGVRS